MMAREKILAYGPPGAGKSYQWLKTAEWLKDEGVNFWVIDTDDAVKRMLATEFSGLDADVHEGGNVHVWEANEWKEYEDGLNWAENRARPRSATDMQKLREQGGMRDWVVVDMLDAAWDEVQRYYVEEIWGMDKGSYFLEARKKMKGDNKMQALDGWKDWTVIKAVYQDWLFPITRKMKAHLYATSKGQGVRDDEDAWAKDMFGPYGVKPRGSKDLPHHFHSVFFFARTGERWHITTVKDRGRALRERDRIHSFPIQYLRKEGWKK